MHSLKQLINDNVYIQLGMCMCVCVGGGGREGGTLYNTILRTSNVHFEEFNRHYCQKIPLCSA